MKAQAAGDILRARTAPSRYRKAAMNVNDHLTHQNRWADYKSSNTPFSTAPLQSIAQDPAKSTLTSEGKRQVIRPRHHVRCFQTILTLHRHKRLETSSVVELILSVILDQLDQVLSSTASTKIAGLLTLRHVLAVLMNAILLTQNPVRNRSQSTRSQIQQTNNLHFSRYLSLSWQRIHRLCQLQRKIQKPQIQKSFLSLKSLQEPPPQQRTQMAIRHQRTRRHLANKQTIFSEESR